jgi:hypothetical protein
MEVASHFSILPRFLTRAPSFLAYCARAFLLRLLRDRLPFALFSPALIARAPSTRAFYARAFLSRFLRARLPPALFCARGTLY